MPLSERPITDYFRPANAAPAPKRKKPAPRRRPSNVAPQPPVTQRLPSPQPSGFAMKLKDPLISSSTIGPSSQASTLGTNPRAGSGPGPASQKRISKLVVHVPSDESQTEPESEPEPSKSPQPRRNYYEPSSLTFTTPPQSPSSSQRLPAFVQTAGSASPNNSDAPPKTPSHPGTSYSPVPSSQSQLLGEESPIRPRQGKGKAKASSRSPSPASSDYNASVGSSQSQYMSPTGNLWSSPVRPPSMMAQFVEPELEIIPSSQPDEEELVWPPNPTEPSTKRTPTKPTYDAFRYVRKRRFAEAFDPSQSSPVKDGPLFPSNNSPPRRDVSPALSFDDSTPVRPSRSPTRRQTMFHPNQPSSPTTCGSTWTVPSPVKDLKDMFDPDADEDESYPPDFPMSLRF